MSLRVSATQIEHSGEALAGSDLAARLRAGDGTLARLREWFAVDFHLFDGDTGELIDLAADAPAIDSGMYEPLCRTVAERGSAELVEDDEPLLVLAIPFQESPRRSLVALSVFATVTETGAGQLKRAARRLSLAPQQARDWLSRQAAWMPQSLVSMGRLAGEKLAADARLRTLESEVRDVSFQLSTTYEEISLLYRLTQNLKLSSSDEQLGRLALAWLSDAVPAESLVMQLVPLGQLGVGGKDRDHQPILLMHGDCPIDSDELTRLVAYFGLEPGQRPLVINPPVTQEASWPWPTVRELVVVSLCEGENCFGWLAAFNHCEGAEFGSVEASLLNSVATILGIHRGNAELYHQQREFFASVVRALTSAIDAKDPYTCGHSDRVARVCVRLAEELGCSEEQIETIYLSGLLHDVGKIGIDDNVLRKPGALTVEEYEHIKTHAEIGYKILVDIKQLGEVLPVVLHHHEQWNGRGYPHGLAAEQIPLLARIAAVADSFDAMGSDRPYRKGMCDEKLDAILREGAGKQWDASVVEAFFRVRDDIRRIAHEPVNGITLELRKFLPGGHAVQQPTATP